MNPAVPAAARRRACRSPAIIRTRPDGVEERAEHQRADEVADGEDREVVPGVPDAPEERGQDVAVGEEDGVVEERLADEQREAQDGPPRVAREHRPRDLTEADRRALPDGDRVVDGSASSRPLSRGTVCSMSWTICSASSSRPWMNSQRGLSGHVAPDHQDRQRRGPRRARRRAASRAPGRGRVQQRDRQQRAGRGADPERPVDREVDRPRYLAGISSSMAELIAAYSPPMPVPVRKRAAKNHIGVIEKRGQHGRHGVDGQGDQEELLAAEPVGELAEEERARCRHRRRTPLRRARCRSCSGQGRCCSA